MIPLPARSSRRAFTIIELLVVISIIAVLMSLLLPALTGARESARLQACSANLRSLSQANHAHAADHAGEYPDNDVSGGNDFFAAALLDYMGGGEPPTFSSFGNNQVAFANGLVPHFEPVTAYSCPSLSTQITGPLHYAVNRGVPRVENGPGTGLPNLNNLGGDKSLSEMVIFAEVSGVRLGKPGDMGNWRYIATTEWNSGKFGLDAPFRPDGSLGSVYDWSHAISPDTSHPDNKDPFRHAGATPLGFLDGHNAIRRMTPEGMPFEEWVLE